jgi:hypothetical protein
MSDRAFRIRPLNTPLNRVKLRQLTNGKEFMLMQQSENNDLGLVPTVEYVGLYHIYPNGAVYTGGVPNANSQPLTKYIRIETSNNYETVNDIPENNLTYAQITGTRFYSYVTPRSYYPVPTTQERRNGTMRRFFAQKINELDIIEISSSAYQYSNDRNQTGIDQKLYNLIDLSWTIRGLVEEVRKANRRVISKNENSMPGLRNFLSDLTEFHE